MTRDVYLDSSALAKLVVPEPETGTLGRYLAGYDRHVSSALAITELGRAVARRSTGDVGRALEVLDRLVLVDVRRVILERAAGLAPATMRSLDAIHVASAIEIRDSIDAFVTYDARQGDVARLHGFRVVAPA